MLDCTCPVLLHVDVSYSVTALSMELAVFSMRQAASTQCSTNLLQKPLKVSRRDSLDLWSSSSDLMCQGLSSKVPVFVQVTQASKRTGAGKWSSRFRSFLVHGAHLAHLDSLLASTSPSVTLVPQPVDMAPFLDAASSSSNKVSSHTGCLQWILSPCCLLCIDACS